MKFFPKKPRHAIYALPNAFTTAALFAGFYSILRAIAGDWQGAAIGVLAATVLDACDGRVARLTGTESSFGAEYDSLADVVAFGVAPAILPINGRFPAWVKSVWARPFVIARQRLALGAV